MIALIIQRSLVSLFLLTTTSMAGLMNSPMSWSPDGEWLGYTIVADPGRDDMPPNWLFDTRPGTREVGDRKVAAVSPLYQIWVTHRNHEASVLVEERRWPLTAPSWSPRGKSIAFGQFVPHSIEPSQAIPRGRFEVVIQDAVNRKRVFWASSDFELDEETRARFPQLAVAWSPDGRYLAFSRPGPQPSILIMGKDSAKVLGTLENATQPAWSPDGSHLAFIRTQNATNNLCLVERHGQTFGPSRQFIGTGSLKAAPAWSGDSQSILVVAEKTTTRSRELVLDRVSPKGGDSGRVLSLLSEPGLRVGSVLGVAIDFDRDRERCFFSADIEGRENDLGVGILREPQIPKRFHPIDNGLRIDSMAFSPDDHYQYLAIRFGSPGSLSPPALYDLTLEQLTLIVPDETARRQWLNTFIGASRKLLISGLPPATADGQVGERPTLLPLPGELPATDVLKLRLIRLARLALPLCDQVPPQGEEPTAGGADSLTTEARLFLAYLLDDFPSAASCLDALETRINSPDDRLSLLSLRAQILWSEGHQARAQAIVNYLVDVNGGYTKRVEETPTGLTVAVEASRKQAWAHYLSARAADGAATQPHRLDMPAELIDIPLQHPFAAPEAPQIDRGAGNAPFAPIFQGILGERDARGIADPDRPDVFPLGRPHPPSDRPAPRFFP